MHPSTVRLLANAEYDFVRLDSALADLASTLHQCAGESLACGPATLTLRRMRRRLRRVLADLDADVTAAVVAQERLGPAPF